MEKKILLQGKIGVGIAGAVALPLALPLLGFTSAGVAAGSIAASIQSAFYGGAAGGVFSAFQERLLNKFNLHLTVSDW